MFIINIATTTILGLGLLWVKRKADQIDSLKQSVKHKAEQLVDQKLTVLATKLEGCIEIINERVTTISERLARGDNDFKDLNERDHALELKFHQRFEQLHEWISNHFATKDDLRVVHQRLDQVKHGAQQ